MQVVSFNPQQIPWHLLLRVTPINTSTEGKIVEKKYHDTLRFLDRLHCHILLLYNIYYVYFLKVYMRNELMIIFVQNIIIKFYLITTGVQSS